VALKSRIVRVVRRILHFPGLQEQLRKKRPVLMQFPKIFSTWKTEGGETATENAFWLKGGIEQASIRRPHADWLILRFTGK
jgi:hypothetical protein